MPPTPREPAETGPVSPPELGADPRHRDAWCRWLEDLARSPDSAVAAAMAYERLEPEGRERWLVALDEDVSRLRVPRIAVYAPLLAVELDESRREQILRQMGPAEAEATPRQGACSFRGRQGSRVAAVLVTPLYLDFVQLLTCVFSVTEGFHWVKAEPLADWHSVPADGTLVDGIAVERTPLKSVVDELSQAVLAHRRSGRELPEELRRISDLFVVREIPGG